MIVILLSKHMHQKKLAVNFVHLNSKRIEVIYLLNEVVDSWV